MPEPAAPRRSRKEKSVHLQELNNIKKRRTDLNPGLSNVFIQYNYYLRLFIQSSLFSSHVRCNQWGFCVGSLSAFNFPSKYGSHVRNIFSFDNALVDIALELNTELSITTNLMSWIRAETSLSGGKRFIRFIISRKLFMYRADNLQLSTIEKSAFSILNLLFHPRANILNRLWYILSFLSIHCHLS